MKRQVLYSTLASIALLGGTGYVAIAQQSPARSRGIATVGEPVDTTSVQQTNPRNFTTWMTSNGETVLPAYPGQSAYGFSTGGEHEFVVIEDGAFRIEQVNGNMDSDMRKKSEEAKKALSEALKTIRSDSSEKDDLKNAKATIASYLSAQFEHDQKKRQDQVKGLEEQIVKLKKQIEKRESKKQELIDLRLAILENDTAGLSFPPAWDRLNQSGGPSGGYSFQGPAGIGTPNLYFPGSVGQPAASSIAPSAPMPPNGVPASDRSRNRDRSPSNDSSR